MNLQYLPVWVIGIVIASASVGKLNVLQRLIWVSEAKRIEAARTSAWGSPRILPKS